MKKLDKFIFNYVVPYTMLFVIFLSCCMLVVAFITLVKEMLKH